VDKVSYFNWSVKDVYNFILYASRVFVIKLKIVINNENMKSYIISKYCLVLIIYLLKLQGVWNFLDPPDEY